MGAKIMHIVGNRPQFIKFAPLTKELHRKVYSDVIVHTGQHYDSNMSDVFFEELGIEKPIENLNVGSGTHAEITARVLVGVEKAVQKYKPSIVILYGDTDSTLGAALACKKINTPIIHVEAGTRSYSKENPEEINRVVVDHLSEVCFCPDKQSVENLKKEGITNNVIFSGDIMYDTFLQTKKICHSNLLQECELEKENFILMTWHRQENTNSRERMNKILNFLERVELKTLYPIHPRTKKMLKDFELWEKAEEIKNLILVNPVGYNEMVYLQNNAKIILTDSGGLSKESIFAGVKCLFMADLNVWPDLERIGWIQHIDFSDEMSMERAFQLIEAPKAKREKVNFYGDGRAAEKMVESLEEEKYL